MNGIVATTVVSVVAIWNAVGSGISQKEFLMADNGPLAHVRAIVVTVDPSKHRFRLDLVRANHGLTAAWSVDSIPQNAVVAVNAGQFTGGFPWGWIVRDGVESHPPVKVSLGLAFVVDTTGIVFIVTPPVIPEFRRRAAYAFQSYPALLVDGEMPLELRGSGRGVDLEHRDSRLAICTRADRTLMIVITRVSLLGKIGATLPYGPTVPEMAAYMRSLGCHRAMLLDGGISSQLAVRNDSGILKRWSNWRLVPLGLVIMPRSSFIRAN
jgi:uncharacterized protein YigE (DUF2233 family)